MSSKYQTTCEMLLPNLIVIQSPRDLCVSGVLSAAIAIAAAAVTVCPGRVTPPSIPANKRTDADEARIAIASPIAAFAFVIGRRGRKHWCDHRQLASIRRLIGRAAEVQNFGCFFHINNVKRAILFVIFAVKPSIYLPAQYFEFSRIFSRIALPLEVFKEKIVSTSPKTENPVRPSCIRRTMHRQS